MPRMTTGLSIHSEQTMFQTLFSRPVQGNSQKRAQERTLQLKKRFAMLSFFDACFYSIAFCLLLISPVNAQSTVNSDLNPKINIYAAHVTENLEASCQSESVSFCSMNVVTQSELLKSLLNNDITGQISQSIENSDYEVLIGSAVVTKKENSELLQTLVFEISSIWRGITLDDAQLSIAMEKADKSEKELIAQASQHLMHQWIEQANAKEIFGADYLYRFLGASDYKNELKVPAQIGDFALNRQHLYNDPMKGMLSRYIHKDFELAVFDVYVYPLKSNDSLEVQTKNELLSEQEDIRLLSKALGKDSLKMTEVYELNDLEGAKDTRVFAFEASLQTSSEPLFATQYAFVKNDKIVKFSINAPARITNGLITQAIKAIQVPAESSLMKQVRHIEQSPTGTRSTSVAP
ncbi:MAG: hypothetical protein ACI9O6_002719 [Glaciecola sp.]|jgi:hypothetical protein